MKDNAKRKVIGARLLHIVTSWWKLRLSDVIQREGDREKGEENDLTQCTAISFLPFPLSVQLVDVNVSSHSDVVDLPVPHVVDWRRTTLHCNIIAVVQASSCV